jgi:nucleotide-binding universal stress UspA family protein
MYKTIIIPIDMSHMERVQSMVDAARNLGPKAELILVNAIETIPSHIQAEIPVGLIQDSMKHSRKALEKVAANVSGKVSVEMAEGHAASAILDIADEKKADAIVIASHKPGWQDYLIGSTAARVVRHAKCSVLVVR